MKLLFTGVVAEIRGKLAGTSFTKGRSGSFARTRVGQVNKATQRQMLWRSEFKALQQLWKTLSEDQRNEWRIATIEYMAKNVFGNSIQLSGINLFLQVNRDRLFCEKPITVLPPVPRQSLQVGEYTITIPVNDNRVRLFVPICASVDESAWLLEATPMQSAGVSNFSKKYATIGFSVEPGDDTFFLDYSNVSGYPSMISGSAIGFKLTIFDTNAALRSLPVFTSVIVP